MENYIVRIYRRNCNDPEQVTGILESVERRTLQTFHSLSTLHSLLIKDPPSQFRSDTSQDNKPDTVVERIRFGKQG